MFKPLVPAAVVALALGLGGCAKADSAAPKSHGNTVITMGVLPNIGDSPIQLGLEKGFFAKHHIDLKLEFAQGFQPNLAAVLNGTEQAGFASTVPLVVAASKNAPITIVAGSEVAPTDPKVDHVAVITRPDEHLTSPKDLAGKTVALVALGNSDSIAVREAVTKAGGDPKSMKFIELGFADQIPALMGNRVDAIVIGEPFRTEALEKGLHELFPALATGMPGLPQSAYFMSTAFAKENPQAVNDLVAALNESTQYAMDHPSELRGVLPKFAKVDAATAQKINLGEFGAALPADGYTTLSKLTIRYGLATQQPDLSTLLHK